MASAQDAQPIDVSASENDIKALLSIKKGSVFAPLLLLLATIALFVVYGLKPGVEQLADNLGLSAVTPKPSTFEALTEALQKPENKASVEAATKNLAFNAETFTKFVLPTFKAFIDQLIGDFGKIAVSTAVNTAQLAAFALIGGLGGLIYRRAFWSWFLGSFAVLMAVNASGIFGALTTAEKMPVSGSILLFIVSQVVIILLVYRLRRHARVISPFPPRVHNRLLTIALWVLAIACIGNWVPGWIWTFLSTRILGTDLFGWLLKWEFILFGLPLLYSLFRHAALWSGSAPKNIVICLDGTSNTPDQYDMGFLAQTNVFKLFKMLKADAPGMIAPAGKFDASLYKAYGHKQIGFYYAGIGNKYDNDPLLGMIGQATGMGASGIIERAYLDLVRVYRPGDRVFICGFSRGAASARLLARAIDARGAPRSILTLRLFGRHWTVWSSKGKQPVKIDVLGCWDTVGSFGIAKTIGGINFQQMNLLHDMTVPDNVVQAYHMVALDEERAEFEPTLMDPDPIRPERIVEVWFSGSHASIGGGWATDRLSDVPFDFLLSRLSSGYCRDGTTEPGNESWGIYLTAVNGSNEAAAARATEGVVVIRPDPLGQLRTWFSKVYTYRPRTLPLHAVISEAVFERMTKSLPVYAPQSLFDHNDALDAKRDLITAKVAKLEETKSLDVAERSAVLEFTDKLRLTRWPQYWDGILSTRKPLSVEARLSNEAMRAPAGR